MCPGLLKNPSRREVGAALGAALGAAAMPARGRTRARPQRRSIGCAPANSAGRPGRPGRTVARGGWPAGAGDPAAARSVRRLRPLLQPVLAARPAGPDPVVRLAGRLALEPERLCGAGAGRRRRQRRRPLRRRPPPAAGRQRRGPQLPGRLQRAGLAAGLDARHGGDHPPRRLHPCRFGCASRACRLARGWLHLGPRLRGGEHQGRPLRAGRDARRSASRAWCRAAALAASPSVTAWRRPACWRRRWSRPTA